MIILFPGVQTTAQSLLKILPLGNSITQGTMCLNGSIDNCDDLASGQQVAYRHRLKTLMTVNGYNTDYIGNYNTGYSVMTDSDNGGFGGITTKKLADIMEMGRC